jgi:hypothetical protein
VPALPASLVGSPVAGITAGPAHATIDQAGHFSAVFPTTATFYELPASIGSSQIMMHMAGVQTAAGGGTSSVELVEEAEFSQALLPSTFDDDLRVVLGSAAGSSGRVAISETALTFQGKPAREGQFSAQDGSMSTILAFIENPTRVFVVAAPAGAMFNALAASLVVLP